MLMPRPLRTIALMISTFSVSITICGFDASRVKNSSTSRRVIDPVSNRMNGCWSRSAGVICRLLGQRVGRVGHEQQFFGQDRNRYEVAGLDGQRHQAQVAGALAQHRNRPLGAADRDLQVEVGVDAAQLGEERREHVEADRHPADQPDGAAQRSPACR